MASQGRASRSAAQTRRGRDAQHGTAPGGGQGLRSGGAMHGQGQLRAGRGEGREEEEVVDGEGPVWFGGSIGDSVQTGSGWKPRWASFPDKPDGFMATEAFALRERHACVYVCTPVQSTCILSVCPERETVRQVCDTRTYARHLCVRRLLYGFRTCGHITRVCMWMSPETSKTGVYTPMTCVYQEAVIHHM